MTTQTAKEIEAALISQHIAEWAVENADAIGHLFTLFEEAGYDPGRPRIDASWGIGIHIKTDELCFTAMMQKRLFGDVRPVIRQATWGGPMVWDVKVIERPGGIMFHRYWRIWENMERSA